MNILVTNDDGIESPGLRAAVEAVAGLGNVTIVAPSRQQTSMARSLKGNANAVLKQIEFPVPGCGISAYHCEATPARAVLHAFDVLFAQRKPDLVVSGINYGENLGTNSTISGTLGAALQAASHGVRGLAVSLQTDIENHRQHVELDWGAARHFCRIFASMMLEAKLPPDVDILNVNVPASASAGTSWRMTRLSRQAYFGNRIDNPSLASTLGEAICHLAYDKAAIEPDSDIRAICDGLVSVTPVSMDLTSRVSLEALMEMMRLPD